MTDINLDTAFSLPSGFRMREVSNLTAPRAVASSAPSLGPLVDFVGTFAGNGFNTIFRPNKRGDPHPAADPHQPSTPPRTTSWS